MMWQIVHLMYSGLSSQSDQRHEYWQVGTPNGTERTTPEGIGVRLQKTFRTFYCTLGVTCRCSDSAQSRMPGGLGERLADPHRGGVSVRRNAAPGGMAPMGKLVSQVERGWTAPSAGVVYRWANELRHSLISCSAPDDVEPRESPRSADMIRGSWGRASGQGGGGRRAAGQRSQRIELSTVCVGSASRRPDNGSNSSRCVRTGGPYSETRAGGRPDGRETLTYCRASSKPSSDSKRYAKPKGLPWT